MQFFTCSNCGAALDQSAKFCRQCGQPSDPSELTTRKLEEPPRYEHPTQPANAGFTSPAYLPPNAFPPQGPVTRSMEQTGQKKTIITLAVLVAVLLVALSGLAIYITTMRGPNIPVPRAPQPPISSTPPQPPTPPPTPGGVTTIGKELIYPGSEVIMEVNSGRDGKVVQLRATDSFDKIVDWYSERINLKNRVRLPGSNTILEGEGVAVVINSRGDDTHITVTEKRNR